MIEFVSGDILAADVEAYVNPVNCVGVSGAGVARLFKEAFPESHKEYAAICRTTGMEPGECFFLDEYPGCTVVYFPTKQHWKDPSKLTWIVKGLADLAAKLMKYGIKSVAVPALGCGHGGLDWAKVVTAMLNSPLNELDHCKVLVYEPL